MFSQDAVLYQIHFWYAVKYQYEEPSLRPQTAIRYTSIICRTATHHKLSLPKRRIQSLSSEYHNESLNDKVIGIKFPQFIKHAILNIKETIFESKRTSLSLRVYLELY